MEKALKIVSWIAMVLGGLAVLSGLLELDGYAFVGGGLFFTQGILSVLYIDKSNKK